MPSEKSFFVPLLTCAVEKLHFVFSSDPSIAYYGRNQKITIPLRAGLSSKDYKKQIHSVVRQRREVIIHELVHHLDGHRVKEDDWAAAHLDYKDPKEDPKGYYNHPVEMNAFFQMGADKVTAEYLKLVADLDPNTGPGIDGSDDHQAAVWNLDTLAKTSWSKFFKDWQRGQLDKNKWWNHLTTKNKRRMQKRVYDLYDKTVLDAKKRIEDLKRRGDPMSELM